MYLNLLLKNKKEPSYKFSFSGSSDIKTDKEQIHRGFRDHKGLTYPFNGPVKPTTDTKLVYQGFNKEYKPNTFHFKTNDNEYLKNFHLHKYSEPVELYTDYKNKYPNLSPNDYSIEMWQTEKGTANELNRFMRQDKTGRSIEDIEADDNEFSNGLKRLEEKIRKRKQDIIEDKDLDEDEKKDKLKEAKDIGRSSKLVVKKYINPVKIKPAIKKDEEYKFDDRFANSLSKFESDAKVSMDYLGKKVKQHVSKAIKSKQNFKGVLKEIKDKSTPKTPEGVDESKTSNTPIPSRPTTPIPSRTTTPVKSRPASPVKTTNDDDYDSDNTTVNNDTITVADNLKPIYQKAQATLNKDKYKDLPNKTNLYNTNPKLYKKLNDALAAITGKPSDIKKLGTLRQKLLVNFN